jgi:serine protease Do
MSCRTLLLGIPTLSPRKESTLMQQFLSAILLLPALAQIPSSKAAEPEQILAEAASYTVEVQVLTQIALNVDDAGVSSGTGFLIDSERGWLLTNAHVATRSPSLIRVSFQDGQQIEAKRIHVDPYIDLAILVIPPAAVPDSASEANLACDDLPAPGTSVLAYGHPWGLSYTATRGIVSGLSWFYPSQLIQTDAVINSGNSGGPLISLADGRVIGINTATYSPGTEDDSGTAISLAEPMPAICHLVSLLKDGSDTRLRMLPVAIATSGDDLRPMVADVFSNESDLAPGDIILRVNAGAPIDNFPSLLSELRGQMGPVQLLVERDGDILNVQSSVRILPDPLSVRAINLSGLIIAEPWKLDDFEVNPQQNLLVHWYEWDKAAALTDIDLLDYIVSVDGKKYTSVEALYAYLKALPADASIDIILKRVSTADEFYREYLHISISNEELEWVSAESY